MLFAVILATAYVNAQKNMTLTDRECTLVAIAACEAKGDMDALKRAVEQLRDIPTVLRNRIGEEEAVRCEEAVAAVLGEQYERADTVDFSVWQKDEPNPYSEYFSGNSYLAAVGGEGAGLFNVTFEPRCRNNWHVHHRQTQVLICVAGRGWYQEWGKPAIEMTPGTVVAVPAEVKHWHGAARDSWFQHLTYHTNVGEGASNEWLEPVADEDYDKLK